MAKSAIGQPDGGAPETFDLEAPPDPAVSAPGFRHLTRETFIYSLGFLSGKAAGFLLLPLMTRILTPDDFGRLDVLSSLASALTGALLLGLDTAAVRLYFDQGSDRARGELLGAWGAIVGTMAAIAAVVLLSSGGAMARALFGPAASAGAGVALALVVPAALAQYFVTTSLRTSGHPAAYAIVATATFVVYAAMIGIVAWLGFGSVEAFLLSWGTALAVTAVGGIWHLRHRIRLRRFRRLAPDLLRLGLPLAPVLALTLGGDFLQRAVLLSAAGPADVARLTVAVRFASLVGLGVASAQLAWQPRVYAMGTSELALRRIAIDSRRLVFGITALGVAAAVVAPLAVPIIAGSSYTGALNVLGWCLVAAILTGVYGAVSTPSAIAKRPLDLAGSAVVGVAVAIAANLILAPRFGSVGTGASIALGQLSSVVLIGWAGRRRLRVPFDWPRMATTVLAGSIASLTVGASGIDAIGRWILVVGSIAALTTDPTTREFLAGVRAWRGSGARRDDGKRGPEESWEDGLQRGKGPREPL